MDFETSMKISASGLSAQRTWMNVISANLANVNTTRTESGKPYERQTTIVEAVDADNHFDRVLDGVVQEELQAKLPAWRRANGVAVLARTVYAE